MERLFGLLELSEDSFPFVLENWQLNILPKNDEDHKKFLNLSYKWFENYNESFSIFGNKEPLELVGHLFSFHTIKFRKSSFFSFENGIISCFVDSFILLDSSSTRESLITGLEIGGREIDLFYPASQTFKSNFDNGISLKSVDMNVKTELGSGFEIREIRLGNICFDAKFCVNHTYRFQNNEPLSAKTKLKIRFKDSYTISDIEMVITAFEQLFQFVFNRCDIRFEDIKIFRENHRQLNEDSIFEIKKFDFKVQGNNESRSRIDYHYFERDHQIFRDLLAYCSSEGYIQPQNSSEDSIDSYDISKCMMIYSKFEKEYRNVLENKYPRSKEFEFVKTNVIQVLEELQKSEKLVKAIYTKRIKSIINLINQESDLSRIISNTFMRYKLIIGPIGKILSKEDLITNTKLRSRMVKFRNSIAHGLSDFVYDETDLKNSRYLEIATLLMRLESVGFLTDEMFNMVIDMYDYYIVRRELLKIND